MTHIRQRMAMFFALMMLTLAAPVSFAEQSQILAAASTQTTASTSVKTVNINTADAATLARELQGIGPQKAQAIVEYREKFGPFINAEDLSSVKGIGMSTVEKNADLIVIE